MNNSVVSFPQVRPSIFSYPTSFRKGIQKVSNNELSFDTEATNDLVSELQRFMALAKRNNTKLTITTIQPILEDKEAFRVFRESSVEIDCEYEDAVQIASMVFQKYSASVNLTKQADEFALNVKDIIQKIEDGGTKSNLGIAKKLNEAGIKPPRAKKWSDVAVRRVKERLSELSQ